MKAIQNEDGKSIKNFSMVLTIVSALMIFSNLGAFAVTSFLLFDMSPGEGYEYKNFGDQMFAWITGHLNMIFAELALFGFILLIPSIFFKKIKIMGKYFNFNFSYTFFSDHLDILLINDIVNHWAEWIHNFHSHSSCDRCDWFVAFFIYPLLFKP